MSDLRWAKVNPDGPSHGWPPDQPDDDLWTALCDFYADQNELVDADEDKCVLCLLAHGTELADIEGDPAWR